MVAIAVALTLALANAAPSRNLDPRVSRTAANPIALMTLLLVIHLLDFAYLEYMGYGEIRGRTFRYQSDEIAGASLVYALSALALIGGTAIGLSSRIRRSAPGHAYAQAIKPLALIFPAIAALLFFAVHGSVFDVAIVGARKALVAGENQFLPFAIWAAIIAIGLFVTTTDMALGKLSALVLALVAVVSLAGARMHGMMLLVFFAGALARRGKCPPAAYLWLAVPVLAVALVAFRYFLRAAAFFQGDFNAFVAARGGPLGTVFGSAETAIAEIFTAVHDGLPFYRAPLEGLTGLALYPLPRSLVGGLKPESASTDFSAMVNPEIFRETGSQVVIGSLTEGYVEFGYGVLGAAFVAGLMFGWLLRYATINTRYPLFWTACCSIGMFIFLRTDVFNLGVFLWPLAAFVVAWRGLGSLTYRKPKRRAA